MIGLPASQRERKATHPRREQIVAFAKSTAISKYAKHETDSGSTAVQVAVLTERINYLTDHFRQHPKDFHGRRGLLRLVGKRRRLLNYLERTNLEEFRRLKDELAIR